MEGQAAAGLSENHERRILMRYFIEKLLEDPIRIFLLIIIIACLIQLFKAAKEVHGWWKAWSAEEQKKKPPLDYIPQHFDKKA
jgi:hypothetical protein